MALTDLLRMTCLPVFGPIFAGKFQFSGLGRWTGKDHEEIEVHGVAAMRMKAAREHRVPLTLRMIKILQIAEPLRTGDFVFPGMKRGKPLSVCPSSEFLVQLAA